MANTNQRIPGPSTLDTVTLTGVSVFNGSSNSFSTFITQTTLGIATAQTVGVNITNTAIAAPGAQQYSPMYALTGQGWSTVAVSSQEVGWAIQNRPIQNTTQPTSDLVFWANVNNGSYNEIVALKYDPISTVYELKSAQAIFGFRNSSGSGVLGQSGETYIYNSGTATVLSNSTVLSPVTNRGIALGAKGASNYSIAWSAYYGTIKGADLDSTGVNITLTPTAAMHHITGAGIIQNINIPVVNGDGLVGAITLIPDGTFTTTTGGNIALGTTAIVGRALIMTFDGTSWYPSY